MPAIGFAVVVERAVNIVRSRQVSADVVRDDGVLEQDTIRTRRVDSPSKSAAIVDDCGVDDFDGGSGRGMDAACRGHSEQSGIRKSNPAGRVLPAEIAREPM